MSQFFEYTKNGIRFKGFQDLRKTLVEAWEATFGSEIDTSPTSPDGHHIDLEAATINSVAEMIQVVATNLNREQASGQFLDLLAALLGLERMEGETDDELRSRMDVADRTGFATYDGMLTYLQGFLGTNFSLKVNDEPYEDEDGIPGHKFRVTLSNAVYSAIEEQVEAGEIENADNYVAQLIWNCKGAGIGSDGNKSGIATDKSGLTHTIHFSLPTTVEIEVSVELSLYTEEAFPHSGTTDVHDAIVGWATGTGAWASPEYVPGKDVIPARFYTPILTVPGISSAVIKVRKVGSTEWSTSPIEVGSQEMAVLTSVSVEVVE